MKGEKEKRNGEAAARRGRDLEEEKEREALTKTNFIRDREKSLQDEFEYYCPLGLRRRSCVESFP